MDLCEDSAVTSRGAGWPTGRNPQALLVISSWSAPTFLRHGLIRATARLRAPARPGRSLHPDPSPPEAQKPLQDFTLKVLMDALDLIECDRRPVQRVMERLWRTRGTFGRWGRPPAHPGLLEWTAGVIPRYLAARVADQQSLRLAGLPPTHPVRDKWVAQRQLGQPDSRGAVIYEQTAWGRRYVALDGSMRDLWLLSFAAPRRKRPAGEKAAGLYRRLRRAQHWRMGRPA